MSAEETPPPHTSGRRIGSFLREHQALVTGFALLTCALVFYYLAVLRIDYTKTSLLDLRPNPDASEYFAQARGLYREGRPLIKIGYEKLPSVFPVGYSALMLPWLMVLPEEKAVLAPFRTSQTAGLLLLLAVFAFYTYLAMPATGGVATLLLATLPGFFTFCRSSMSDISAWLLFVLAFMFAYLGVREERRWKIYLAAVFLGLAVDVRLQSLFFAPLLFAMALLPANGNRWRWLFHCCAVGVVFLLAASPILVVNFIEFKSPFIQGGSFWYPPGRRLFSTEYILTQNAAMFWRELTLQPDKFYAANVFGSGTVFVPSFILLVIAGAWFVKVRRTSAALFLAGFAFLFMTLIYKYPNGRYYSQLLILLIPLAVLPVSWAARNIRRSPHIIAALGLFLLFGATVFGFPSRAGYRRLETNRLQTWDAMQFRSGAESRWFVAYQSFAQSFASKPCVVFSDIDSVYLNALLPGQFIAAPVDARHKRRFSPVWRYGKPEAAAVLARALSEARPIYALFVSAQDMEQNSKRLPQQPGYGWRAVISQPKVGVMELLPSGAAAYPQ